MWKAAALNNKCLKQQSIVVLYNKIIILHRTKKAETDQRNKCD